MNICCCSTQGLVEKQAMYMSLRANVRYLSEITKLSTKKNRFLPNDFTFRGRKR